MSRENKTIKGILQSFYLKIRISGRKNKRVPDVKLVFRVLSVKVRYVITVSFLYVAK